ncbi:Uu.00g020780.m01.CDS01 [Anthostomella pinea]|uniref:Uu.00g020780.m01.CDS01 n=1 Tax=Anthostomella pinea TaxID=933095 RepID=A0AAI8VZI8_9PEZI|nr:Uu.00g020780.m01.CDS01 [Anthostomella pinea]
MAHSKVAIVTGGTLGIGFAVSKSLLEDPDGGWEVYILYHSSPYKVSQALPRAHLKQADVTSWQSLSKAFSDVFEETGRLDFVFANAGVLFTTDFFADMTGNTIEPIDMSPVDYASQFAPVYSATKAGVVHFMRSIAKPLFQTHGVRVHAICPGAVHTTLVSSAVWAAFPIESFISVKDIVAVVRHLMSDQPLIDSAGRRIALESKFGLAVEVGTTGLYIRDEQKFSDPVAQSSLAVLSMLEESTTEE